MYLDLNDGRYVAWIDTLPSTKEEHVAIANGKYIIDSYEISNYNDIYTDIPTVKIGDTAYVDVRILCYTFGAPLEIKNKTIDIGECFTDTDDSRNKIKQILSTQPEKMIEQLNKIENNSNTLSSAYLTIIQNKLNDNGYIVPSTVGSIAGNFDLKTEGMLFAKLIDFNNDGIKELFILESLSKKQTIQDFSFDSIDSYYSIYAYKDGIAKLIASDKLFFSDSASKFGFSTAKNGMSYFYIDAFEHEEFYTINNEVWTKTNLKTSSVYDWSVSGSVNGKHVWAHSNISTITGGYIDNKLVTYDELIKYKDNLTANNHEYYGAVVNKMPDGTIQKVINELSNMN